MCMCKGENADDASIQSKKERQENREIYPQSKSQHMNTVYNMTNGLFLLGLLDLGNPSKPVNEHGSEDVEDDVDPHEAEVAPRIGVVTVHGLQERVGATDGAERA